MMHSDIRSYASHFSDQLYLVDLTFWEVQSPSRDLLPTAKACGREVTTRGDLVSITAPFCFLFVSCWPPSGPVSLLDPDDTNTTQKKKMLSSWTDGLTSTHHSSTDTQRSIFRT